MIEPDQKFTFIAFDGNPETVVTHHSTSVIDNFGTRACTITFSGDNHAYAVDENDNIIQELPSIVVRATEFTTIESMPAMLPPNSAYTYCVEQSVDGVRRVKFAKPVITWVDNFLGFEVGSIVPAGYYDTNKGVWISSGNGVVVRLLDQDGDGVVDSLDADGDSAPDDLNANGSFRDEVAGLENSSQYPPWSTYWRVKTDHFTAYDFNWPFGPQSQIQALNGTPYPDEEKQLCDECGRPINSYVEERGRVFHEDIPIPGTSMNLHYSSSRVPGYKTKITIPLSQESIPQNLNKILLYVNVAGRWFKSEYNPTPNLIEEFVWDGLDFMGNDFKGIANIQVNIGYEYDAFYMQPATSGNAFGSSGSNITNIKSRQPVTGWKQFTIAAQRPKGSMAEGWTLSPHHFVDMGDLSTLHKGSGGRIKTNATIIESVAGNGTKGYNSDGLPAKSTQLNLPGFMAMDSQGNLYFNDMDNFRIRKLDRINIISTVAGNGNQGDGGDGGAATEASLNNIWSGIAVDGKGNIYIADGTNCRIRKVDSNGIITTIAGYMPGYTGDYGPANQARLNEPTSIVIDKEANLYFTDTANHCIRRIDTNGIITTIAGKGTAGFSGDGGSARDAMLNTPMDIDIDSRGNIYFSDLMNQRIRKIDTTGKITTVAGTGVAGFTKDNVAAIVSQLNYPQGIEIDSEDNLYIADTNNNRIRKINKQGIIYTVAGDGNMGFTGDMQAALNAQLHYPVDVVASHSGELYISDKENHRIRRTGLSSSVAGLADNPDDQIFVEDNGAGHFITAEGLHYKTVDIKSGVVIAQLEYDAERKLNTITDRFNNQVTIERDGNGTPTAIISPDNIRTKLTIDADNHLTRVIFPDTTSYSFEYSEGSLMTEETDPAANVFTHVFDSTGRVGDIHDQEGGHWSYNFTTDLNENYIIDALTGEGNKTTYTDSVDPAGNYSSTIVDATGGTTYYYRTADGFNVSKTLPCGMDLDFEYGIDPEFQYKFLKKMVKTTPDGLVQTVLADKIYSDTDSDGSADLISDTISRNGNIFTFDNNTLSGQKNLSTPEGRDIGISYNPTDLLVETISVPGFFDTTYEYDSRGRATSISTNTRETRFTYDSDGNLNTVTDPQNHMTTYNQSLAIPSPILF